MCLPNIRIAKKRISGCPRFEFTELVHRETCGLIRERAGLLRI